GENLAVNLDAGQLQAVHHAAVRQAILARTRVDAGDPQGAELALLHATVAVRVLAGLDDRLFRDAIDAAAGAVVALRFFQDFLVSRAGDHTTFYSCHVGSSGLRVRQHLANRFHVALRDHARRAQLTLTLGAFLGQDVAAVR